MSSCHLIVVSCPPRKPIQDIWWKYQRMNWPDCPFPITVLSPALDIGWNANLISLLSSIDEEFVLLLLDDHWLDCLPDGETLTGNMEAVLSLMEHHPDIALVKVQAGNAYAPEIPFVADDPILQDRLREYDRASHACKRTNLVPTVFRRNWLRRLTTDILARCGSGADRGRNGALRFEQDGTTVTEDALRWPERMLGIHRPGADGSGGRSLLNCLASDGIREGRLQRALSLEKLGIQPGEIEGIVAFV